MSEQHVETNPGNGAGVTIQTRNRKAEIAKSSMENGIVTFVFNDGKTVSCDVKALPSHVQFDHAVEGVRTSGRLSFQKMDDPAKAAEALRARFAKMESGDVTKARTRSVKETDPLVQAFANLSGKSVKHIEEVSFPRYFKSEESGCRWSTVNGKTRMYGKKEALEKLRLDPGVKPEYDKIVRERAAKATKANPAKKLDLASMTA